MAHEHGPVVSLYARHGTTELNASGCFRGMKDLPLDDKGIQDAHRLAEFLKNKDFYPIIVLSDMQRAQQTAKIIKEALSKAGRHVDLSLSQEIRPLNVGKLSGQKRTPENEAIVTHHANHPDEAFDGGESLNDFRRRVHPVMVQGIETAIRAGVPVLFVAHSSTVHEIGNVTHKDHLASLVLPGGLAEVYACGNRFCSEPVLKPDMSRGKRPGQLIS